ncbi:MAG: DUF72 domain-containing protein [candidate division WOR-3 bacterium]
MIKIGCCGFPVARERYYKKFSVVEVQSTFYDFVNPKTLEKWRAEAPEDFEFVLKAFQFITHPASSPTYRRAKQIDNIRLKNLGNFQPTKEILECYKILTEYADILKTKVIIFQSPPGFKPERENIKNMERFFNKIDRKNLLFGWEPRGNWLPETIKIVCEKLDLIDVVDPFLRDSTHGKIFYFRLHGGKGYKHKFTDEELKTLAEKIKGKTGYVMFNNIKMFEDGQRFMNIGQE